MKARADLKVAYPKADRIKSLVKIDPEERGARLGVLEMQGYVKNQSETETLGFSLPNGVCASGLTNLGRRALAAPRW